MRLNVCRLCLSCEELIWVYDKDNIQCDSSTDFQEIVYLTSGVKILAQDMISQKICKGCQNIIMTIWKFRTKSIEMDTFLKDQLEKYLRGGKLKVPNTETILRYNQGVMEHNGKQGVEFYVEKQFQDQIITVPGSLTEIPDIPYQQDNHELTIKAENMELTTMLPTKTSSMTSQTVTTLLPTTMVPQPTMMLPTTIVTPASMMLPTTAVPPAKIILPATVLPTIMEPSEMLDDQRDPYTCDICSHIVEDGDPDKIRAHRRKHGLRCKYCRKGYVGTKILNNHIENRCHYRKALISNPQVVVKRVDESPKLRKKYPDAFKILQNDQVAVKSTSAKQQKYSTEHKNRKKQPYKRPKKKLWENYVSPTIKQLVKNDSETLESHANI